MVFGQEENESMKIAIDARMYGESGIGRYIKNLISELQKIDSKNEYYILHLSTKYDRLVYHNNFHKVLADVKWYGAAEQIRLPLILNQINADLVHFPHFNVPIFYKGKFVVTIHDLIHQHFQMRRVTTREPITYKLKQLGYNAVFKNALNKSLKILTPSNYVKNLLVDDWKVDSSKIVVTPEAVEDKLFTIVGSLSSEKVKKTLYKFNINQPFLFYVGNAHPHKNIEGLIKAFLMIKDSGVAGAPQNDSGSLKLVLSGPDNYFWQKIKKDYQQKDIIYTGFVSEEELAVLYKSAQAFVMPSFEEGFGIPILEAMAAGTPVVSSNAGSLPEVGGNAATYFDPKDLDDMGNKIIMVLNSEKIRKDLIAKGKIRVKDFSWKKLAEQTLEVHKQCV